MHPLLTRRQLRPADVEPDPSLTREHWLWALEALCRSHRVSFDLALLRQGQSTSRTWTSLRDAAATLGLACETRNMRLSRMPEDWLPCLVLLRDAPPAGDQAFRPAMLTRIKAGQVQYFVPGEVEARRDSVTSLGKLHPGNALLVSPAKPGAQRSEPAPAGFGARWLPELLK